MILLEPNAWKPARSVLRGERSSNTPALPDSKEAYEIPRYLTPVPGGVGPTQMAVLLERIMKVAEIEIQPWDYQKDILKPL